MSLIGLNLIVKDIRSSYSLNARLMIFQSNIELENLNLEQLKCWVRDSVKDLDIWWGNRPYLRIRLDTAIVENIKRTYSSTLLSKEWKRLTTSTATPFTFGLVRKFSEQEACQKNMFVLSDLCNLTGEGFQRLLRSPELHCELLSVIITENMFERAIVLDG